MRPLHLEVEGFTAFRERTEIDFAGADYFVLVGPTGSGKSSVLDAICFALYGSVPRYGDDRLVAPAITQGVNEARVSLTFEVAGDKYTATRVVRRTKAGATTKEARLERGDEILAGDARAMNSAVAEVIGLPFRHFTQCVVLPQGEFARLLHETPADRQELLVRLLDLGVYERMLQRANSLAAEGTSAIRLDDQRLEALSDCTPEAQARARARVAELKDLRRALKKGDAEVRALQQAATNAQQEADATTQIFRHLNAVRTPGAVKSLGQEQEQVRSQGERAKSDRVAAEASLARQTQKIDRLAEPGVLQIQIDTRGQLSKIGEQLIDLDKASGDLQARLQAARAALAEATAQLNRAESDYDAAVEDTAAMELAAELRVGKPCPVCEQIIQVKPKVRIGEKQRVSKAREAARKREAEARRNVDKLTAGTSEIGAEIKALQGQQTSLKRKVAGASPLKTLTKQLADVETARAQHQELDRKYRHAVTVEHDFGERLDALAQRLTDARAQLEQQRDPLVAAGLEVPGVGRDLVASWTELTTWAASAAPRYKQAAAEHAKRAKQQADASAKAIQALTKLSEDAGIGLSTASGLAVDTLREHAAAAEQEASSESQRISAGIKEHATISERIRSTREQVEVATELARLLRSNRFEQWIVNEALAFLVEGASTTLEQLSGGQYALSVNEHNEFEVRDHRNAGEQRSVMTLSGGETFQASLALALALADHVGSFEAGSTVKLESVFLDEGFGTLDADSLDTVAATLEALGHDGRTVGIVTHVRELADRVPVRYEIIKGSSSATVTRVDA